VGFKNSNKILKYYIRTYSPVVLVTFEVLRQSSFQVGNGQLTVRYWCPFDANKRWFTAKLFGVQTTAASPRARFRFNLSSLPMCIHRSENTAFVSCIYKMSISSTAQTTNCYFFTGERRQISTTYVRRAARLSKTRARFQTSLPFPRWLLPLLNMSIPKTYCVPWSSYYTGRNRNWQGERRSGRIIHSNAGSAYLLIAPAPR